MATYLEGQSNLYTKQGESAGGNIRALPNLGTHGLELRKVNLNGHLNPEMSAEEVRDYLLDPNIYGPRLKLQGRSRNSGIR